MLLKTVVLPRFPSQPVTTTPTRQGNCETTLPSTLCHQMELSHGRRMLSRRFSSLTHHVPQSFSISSFRMHTWCLVRRQPCRSQKFMAFHRCLIGAGTHTAPDPLRGWLFAWARLSLAKVSLKFLNFFWHTLASSMPRARAASDFSTASHARRFINLQKNFNREWNSSCYVLISFDIVQ